MSEFPNNSERRVKREGPEQKAAASEGKKVPLVASEGQAVVRKPPLGRRFVKTFFGGDAQSVWGFIVNDVFVPAFKDVLIDAVTKGAEQAIFGEVRSRGRNSYHANVGPATGYNYNSRYSPAARRHEEMRPEISPRGRAAHDFDEIVFESRVLAEEVLDRLYDLISQFGQATVADLYTMANLSERFTDHAWGWTQLDGSRVLVVRGGYVIDLPAPRPLRN